MSDGKLHFRAKTATINEQGAVKLKARAIEPLLDVVNQTNLSVSEVVTQMVLFVIEHDLISFDRE